jgi:4-hydroxybenzoate polyprenyltransferase
MMGVSIDHGRLRPQLPAAVRRYVWSARVGDFAVLAAIPLLGFAYGIEGLTPSCVFVGAALLAASLLMLVHIYALNDWADFYIDANVRPPGELQTSRGSLLIVSLIALGCFVGLLWSAWPRALAPAAFVIVASAVYSLQWPIRGKEVPVLSSGLHAISGAACFLLGLAAATELSTRWSGVWVFLALSMAAGHVYQEISDLTEDLASRARTHATALGPRKAFVLGQLMFTAAFIALLLLPSGPPSRLFGLLMILAWVVNLALATACWRRGITPEAAERYRTSYRLLYLLIGVCLLLRTPALENVSIF